MKILTQISLNGSFCISYREKSPEGPPETCFLTGDPAKNEVQGLKRPLPVVLKTSEVAKRKEEAGKVLFYYLIIVFRSFVPECLWIQERSLSGDG